MQKQDFSLIYKDWEYRNREDQTILRPGVLVVGSQNVVTNTSGRLQLVKGYTLDGQASTTLAGILASYDFQMSVGGYIRHLRGYLDPTSGLGILQYRYVSASGTVTWRDLKIDMASANINFCDFYDQNSEKKAFCLFVDGSNNIYEWSGGITTYASATTNTLTKEGTTTWAEEGFYNVTAVRKVTLNGVDYTYTGGEGTTTLTGVTPDPTLASNNPGDPIHQTVITTANTSLASFPATFNNALIANLRNQIYVGSLDFRSVYISKQNNYKDYSFATPRAVGEGALVTLDGNPVALIPQEDKMYFSALPDYWYTTKFTLSGDLASEIFEIERLKTGSKQGALSQAMVSKTKNDVIFVSNEPTLTTIGRVAGVIATPQMGDISYPVINDFNSYDFTDGCVFYDRNFLYTAVPQHGLIRIYNQTDASRHYWEAPVTYPISRFSIIDGEIYGHSYNTPETYKLFDGYNFNGQPIPANAVFSYQNFGSRSQTKGFNEVYLEGYINENTTLTLNIRKEMDGCSSDYSSTIDGSDRQFVCVGGSSAPLGKDPLGFNPLGGDLSVQTGLPPKFRKIFTMTVTPYFYEVQFGLSNSGVDQRWEIIGFGPLLIQASDLNNSIKS